MPPIPGKRAAETWFVQECNAWWKRTGLPTFQKLSGTSAARLSLQIVNVLVVKAMRHAMEMERKRAIRLVAAVAESLPENDRRRVELFALVNDLSDDGFVLPPSDDVGSQLDFEQRSLAVKATRT